MSGLPKVNCKGLSSHVFQITDTERLLRESEEAEEGTKQKETNKKLHRIRDGEQKTVELEASSLECPGSWLHLSLKACSICGASRRAQPASSTQSSVL